MMNRKLLLLLLMVTSLLPGCYSLQEINRSFQVVDQVYKQEYDATEDRFRRRVIDGPADVVYPVVKNSIIRSGLNITKDSQVHGEIIGQAKAPTPLDLREWRTIIDKEDGRLRQLSGGALFFLPNPSDYTIFLRATIGSLPSGKVLVTLHFRTDSDFVRSRGMIGLNYPPPTATQLATEKFWKIVDENLKSNGLEYARIPSPSDFSASQTSRQAVTTQPAGAPQSGAASASQSQLVKDALEKSKVACRELGFVERTEKFGECVLKLTRP